MSDTAYYTTREALKDRWLRKLELLHYISMDLVLPWAKVADWLSAQEKSLNKGNSERTMKTYLTEFAKGGFGSFDGDYFRLNDQGKKMLKEQLGRVSAWFKPIPWAEEDLRRLHPTQ